MDGLDLLIADHNRFRGIFTRFQEAKDNEDVDEMGELADKLAFELKVHTDLEEKIFYPAVRKLDEEIAEVVDEGLQEHHVGDVLVEEASTLQPGEDEWVAKITVLIESVEHHIDEEEEELFPQVRTKSDAETRAEWGARMEAMKAEQGAPKPADAEKLSLDELKQLASEQQIANRSKMSREDLAAAVDAR
ncbi:MAG: hemerythrin domain-containing protein [Pseudonocardiales bacterium]|nr:hemerythrin domain-containing protein [Pseudonocardiales bacterium]